MKGPVLSSRFSRRILRVHPPESGGGVVEPSLLMVSVVHSSSGVKRLKRGVVIIVVVGWLLLLLHPLDHVGDLLWIHRRTIYPLSWLGVAVSAAATKVIVSSFLSDYVTSARSKCVISDRLFYLRILFDNSAFFFLWNMAAVYMFLFLEISENSF